MPYLAVRKDPYLALAYLVRKDARNSHISVIHYMYVDTVLFLIQTQGHSVKGVNIGGWDTNGDCTFIISIIQFNSIQIRVSAICYRLVRPKTSSRV